MKSHEFLAYLNKFVTVELKDGTVHAGYITNPKDFDDSDRDDFLLHLLVGVSYDQILLSDILNVKVSSRLDHNDTISLDISHIKSNEEE